ncbi:calmodulin-binding protein 25-like [Salvia splendens]|uniref:calmodulin-binding protein 25-like n=1 Tax=Salvia splendens TaxID=180675 RepID=UPI00110219C3|nr:calmodulin-binding protein 25-like [Salvia splendens]
MASDNLMAMELPWMFRPTFGDSWIADIQTDTLTKALQNSISTTSSDGDAFAKPSPPTASENDAAAPKQRRSLPPCGRVSKRKSRASKRAATTFIAADPANFRQMVQQVTGVRFSGQLAVLKPEPQRAFGRMQQPSSFDTLDGSSAAAAVGLKSFCSFPTLESWKVM